MADVCCPDLSGVYVGANRSKSIPSTIGSQKDEEGPGAFPPAASRSRSSDHLCLGRLVSAESQGEAIVLYGFSIVEYVKDKVIPAFQE